MLDTPPQRAQHGRVRPLGIVWDPMRDGLRSRSADVPRNIARRREARLG